MSYLTPQLPLFQFPEGVALDLAWSVLSLDELLLHSLQVACESSADGEVLQRFLRRAVHGTSNNPHIHHHRR